MKRIFKQKFELAAILFVGLLVGCSSDDTAILNTPDGGGGTTETATIRITEGGATDDKFTAEAMGAAGETTQGRVIFTTNGSTQRRMYVTQQLPGESPIPFQLPLTNKGTKKDGSIDLDGENKDSVDFTFDLNVPSSVTDGAITYQFWTTTGRGDFRDPSKRNILGDAALNVGTITVTVGTGSVMGSVREYTAEMLAAPLEDKSSNSFFSLINGGEIYKITDGPETVSFWDFGYYYGATGLASLASTNNYPSNIIDIVEVANANKSGDEELITEAELNKFYIAESSKTVADFDAVAIASDLSDIVKPTTERVTMLEVDDILEFEDASGRKGLIKIVSIVPGDGSGKGMTIDVKVQP